MSRLSFIEDKIMDLEAAKLRCEMWKFKGDKVIFTNGCFDLLHKGHVTYLAKAAEEGTRLIIGLNSDQSVREQGKGDDRPINDEQARALVLAALGFVDAIIFFEAQTPLDLI
jgi:rfaE bifunctional protein nucleotidyltransferase chain/domain